MTTNHIERLEPALLRPGRVDAVHLIDHATSYQIEELFCNFYPNEETTRDDAKIFAQTLNEMDDIQFSIADVQGYLMQYKQSPEKALDNTNQLREMVQSRTVSSSSSVKKDFSETNHDAIRTNRRVTASEVDKMAFNPQEGWEYGQVDRP